MSDNKEVALDLQGIDLHYGYVKALDGVNFNFDHLKKLEN